MRYKPRSNLSHIFTLMAFLLGGCVSFDLDEYGYNETDCRALSKYASQDFLSRTPNLVGDFNRYDDEKPNDVSSAIFQSNKANKKTAVRRTYKKLGC